MIGELLRPGVTEPSPRARARRSPVRLLVLFGLLAAVVIVVVRALVVQSFVVPTASMAPTVHPGDRVLVSRVSYLSGPIRRGDVVVFDGGGLFGPGLAPVENPLAGLGRDLAAVLGTPIGARDYVKRVIGLPGERVVCCDAGGRLTVDGRPLLEPYLHPADVASTVRFDVTVPPGRLWVMGDHRGASADSRAYRALPGGGTVPIDRVVGKVAGVYWPPGRAGRLPAVSGATAVPAAGQEDGT